MDNGDAMAFLLFPPYPLSLRPPDMCFTRHSCVAPLLPTAATSLG